MMPFANVRAHTGNPLVPLLFSRHWAAQISFLSYSLIWVVCYESARNIS